MLLVGDQESVVNVPRSALPPEADQGHVLRLELSIDYEETSKRRESVQEKIDRLKLSSEDE